MRKFGMLAMVVALVVVTQSAFGQLNPDYFLRFSTGASGDPGGTATVSNIIDTANGIGVAGWSWGVCQSAEVDIADVVDGAATTAISPAFNAPQLIPGDGWTVGVVVDFGGMTNLAAADNNELHISTYNLLSAGTATISYCDTIGTPLVDTVLVLSDQSSVFPDREDGTIQIGGVSAGPPVMTVATVDGTAGGSVSVAVTLDNEEDIEGFSYGCTHDGTLVSVTDVAEGAATAATNGNSGPDFFGPNLSPVGGTGYTVGCVVSFSASDVIPAGTGNELVVATYSIDAGAPDMSTSPLNLVGTIGMPIVTLAVVVDNASVDPDVVAGAINIAASTQTLFRRGDANQDGDIDVADAVTVAEALFMVGGTTIDCDDTADTDDNGMLEPTQDTLYLLNFLFLSGPAVPAPYPNCGVDPTDNDGISCDSYTAGC